MIYHDNNDTDGRSIATGVRYGIEDASIGGRPSRGEDNEASVARILLDLTDATNDGTDRDRVTLGLTDEHSADTAWLKITKPVDTLDKFWDALTDTASNRETVDYGAIFQAHNVSPQPDAASVTGTVSFADEPPTFRWTIPTGGTAAAGFANPLLNNFGVKIFTDSFAFEMHDSGFLGNVTEWTPGFFTWSSLTSFPGDYHWVVYGAAQTVETVRDGSGATYDYDTGPYWSDAVDYTVAGVIPEPSALALAATALAGTIFLRRRTIFSSRG
jgi:hypothetical protein